LRPGSAHPDRLIRAGAVVAAVAAMTAPGAVAHAAAGRVPAAQVGADRAAQAAGLGYRSLSDERTHTLWATVIRGGPVRSAPDAAASTVGTVRTRTFFGTSELVLVLGTAEGADGTTWQFVRYPGLGPRTGWVPDTRIGPTASVSTQLVINRRHPSVRLYKHGRLVFRARAGVGARRSPTPGGNYYVRERLIPPSPDSIYGALAFGLSAYSRFRTDWPGGGQVGLHGTNEPDLIPGHISNGCIRLRNRDVLRLDRFMSIGTPVLIV